MDKVRRKSLTEIKQSLEAVGLMLSLLLDGECEYLENTATNLQYRWHYQQIRKALNRLCGVVDSLEETIDGIREAIE